MKKVIKLFLLFIFCSLLILPVNAKENKLTIYFFHGDGCPHCAEEKLFLDKISKDVKIEEYEVWYNTLNEELYNKVKEVYKIKENGVPLTIIGNTYFVGYNEAIGRSIKRAINYYNDSKNNYSDNVDKIIEGKSVKTIKDSFSEFEEEQNEKFIYNLPFFGKVNLKNLSISSVAALIGLIDGFNPCAMWVLLFLISILIGMKDNKKMLIIGFTFLITSALVYMLIMFSWLNIIIKVSTSVFIRYVIGALAIIGGILNLYNYFKSPDSGCKVVDNKRRKSIISYIKKITSEKSFILMLLGVILLAIAVNIIELTCSLGLPVIFTQLLAINDIKGIVAFFYTLIYIFFFLIDDLIIFLIAMFTMNVTGFSTKYNKYSHLIGGIIMLIVGILLIFNYKLLVFGF